MQAIISDIFFEPHPKLEGIKYNNISSWHGLLDWLKEERKGKINNEKK